MTSGMEAHGVQVRNPSDEPPQPQYEAHGKNHTEHVCVSTRPPIAIPHGGQGTETPGQRLHISTDCLSLRRDTPQREPAIGGRCMRSSSSSQRATRTPRETVRPRAGQGDTGGFAEPYEGARRCQIVVLLSAQQMARYSAS